MAAGKDRRQVCRPRGNGGGVSFRRSGCRIPPHRKVLDNLYYQRESSGKETTGWQPGKTGRVRGRKAYNTGNADLKREGGGSETECRRIKLRTGD